MELKRICRPPIAANSGKWYARWERMLHAAATDLPRVFGHYYLEAPLSAGGMGQVYLAVAVGIEERCVIKTILPEWVDDKTVVNRFVDEARIMVQIDHDHVVRCFDCGRVEGTYYIAMEYVHGKTLADMMDRCYARGRLLPLGVGLYVADRVLEALDHIHRALDRKGRPLELVHRDLSPDNILIGFDGSVKLADFGLARTQLLPSRTQKHIAIGKWGYMAPEQARHTTIDGRTDLYGLGSVLFEVFSGRRLIDDSEEDRLGLWQRVVNPTHPRLTTIRPELPRDFDDLVLRAVAADPADRYPDAQQMRVSISGLTTRTATISDLAACVRDLFEECEFVPPPLPDLSNVQVDDDKSVVFALSEITASRVFRSGEIPIEWSRPNRFPPEAPTVVEAPPWSEAVTEAVAVMRGSRARDPERMPEVPAMVALAPTPPTPHEIPMPPNYAPAPRESHPTVELRAKRRRASLRAARAVFLLALFALALSLWIVDRQP